MNKRAVHNLLILLIVVAFCACGKVATAQDSSREFHWQGKLRPDQIVEIKGINGDIQAQAVDGDQIEVSAEKTGRGADEIRIEVVDHAEGVTICAVYPTGRPGRANQCTPGREWKSSTEGNNARVEFTVRLPRNLRFRGMSVNGGVEAEDMGRQVHVSSVNGSVRASTASWAEATTVNGSVAAKMGKADWPETLEISTVNGRIELDLPSTLDADVEFKSVNGNIQSDFPITITGRAGGTISGHNTHFSGRIGNGGRGLQLETVNGNVTLRKTEI